MVYAHQRPVSGWMFRGLVGRGKGPSFSGTGAGASSDRADVDTERARIAARSKETKLFERMSFSHQRNQSIFVVNDP